MEDRVTELETRVAFQEDELAKLGAAMLAQAQQIYHLERELGALGARLASLVPTLPPLLPGQEPPPPHY